MEVERLAVKLDEPVRIFAERAGIKDELQRQIIQLAMEDLTYIEIAQVLGCHDETVRKYVKLAKSFADVSDKIPDRIGLMVAIYEMSKELKGWPTTRTLKK
jgi:hypothetical protein